MVSSSKCYNHIMTSGNIFALGEAEAILLRASATAQGIRRIAQSISQSPGGIDAVSLTVAEKYVEAFGQLAKKGTSIIVPASASDAGSMIAQVNMLELKRLH